jgi:CheY-like chemotaxis protein
LVCRIDADVPIIVRADPDRLRQVLVNLVNNAIKFTDRGSVVVRVTPESSSPGHAIVRFTVSDTGTGIAPDRLHRLFKAFSQADASTTRAYGGTGLGLVISKQISELMGGRIGVESEHGRGSTFWFTIDFAVPAAPAAPPAWATVDPRNLRILAVDDSPVQRDALMHQLGVWGLRASAVESGDAALEAMLEAAAGGDPYRVALVDRDMPEMDGAELAMAARSRKELRGVVMMAMLTAEDAIEPDRLRAMGFSGFMSKPIRQSQLLDAIMDAIAASDRHAAPPVRATEVSAKTVGCPACPPVACLRILIAEDNEVNQIVTREVLTRSGYQCTVVPDGRAAVEHARSGLCDLVLMDCQMPVMDGFEATREIRKLEAAGSTRQRIPIIALTANAMKEDRQRCIDAGMDAYASKPINPGELLETINRTVRLVQQAAAAA